MPTTPIFTVVAADVRAAVDAIVGGLRWFGAEAKAAVGWVDAHVPGAQGALAALFQAADAEATVLEGHAAAGLADVVASAVDEAGTTLGNLISASGLDLAGKAVLTAADVAAISAAKSIATGAISVAVAKLLGDAAPKVPAPSP